MILVTGANGMVGSYVLEVFAGEELCLTDLPEMDITRKKSVFRYLKQALEKGVISCDGNGEETREYINVKDAAHLSVQILQEEYRNKHIIVSGHHPMKFKDMLFMIKEILQKDIRIEFSPITNRDHYHLTPYSFTPKIGHKLVNYNYLDIGQGLLECLHEISNK